MVTTTLKTSLNEKGGYHFCQVILLFSLRQKVVPCAKYKMDIFIRSSRDPRKMANDPGWKNTELELRDVAYSEIK